MKKIFLAGALSAAIAVVPVAAQAHPGSGGHGHKGKSHKCAPHKVGYTAHGVVTLATLVQSAGADTPDDSSDDRYSGDLQFTVRHQNHHARRDAGRGTYALENIRATFADGLTAATVAPGDRVKVIGKITTVAKRCSDRSAAGRVTLRRVVFHHPEDTTTQQGATA